MFFRLIPDAKIASLPFSFSANVVCLESFHISSPAVILSRSFPLISSNFRKLIPAGLSEI
mgnify:CR=1